MFETRFSGADADGGEETTPFSEKARPGRRLEFGRVSVWATSLLFTIGIASCVEAEDDAASTAKAAANAKAAAATAAPANFEGWEETAGLQLMVDGALAATARIFDAPNFQHTLVVPEGDVGAFLLALKAQTVTKLSSDAVQWNAEGYPLPSLDGEELGMFFNDDGILSFDGIEHAYVIQPEPPLVGMISLEKLIEAKPDYALAAAKYEPNAKAVAALKGVTDPVTVKVFFGTWCSYCKHWLPHFMKTMEQVGGKNYTLEFYGMSEDQSEPAEPLAEYDISLTPSFVVLKNGQEVGRIEEEPLVSMEVDITQMLVK